MKKKLAAFILAGLFTAGALACLGGCEKPEEPPEKPEHLGLYSAEDGTMMKDGEAFYGFGVNYYSLLNRAFTNRWDVTDSLSSMKVLADYGVKVIRFNAAGYAYTDWDYVVKKEERYFETFDKLVKKAEELDIGLIPSLFWNATSVADYFDEPYALAWRTDKTETAKFMRSFTEKVVARYQESPAVYGWEFGNEVALNIDLNTIPTNPLPAGSKRTERNQDDVKTSEDYRAILSVFAEAVEDNDPYKRIFSGGDAEPRYAAYNLEHNKQNGWKADTLEEHQMQMDSVFASVTSHSYHAYAPDNLDTPNHAETIPNYVGAETWEQYMAYLVNQSKRTKKPFYIGETGWLYTKATASTKPTIAQIETVVKTIFDAAVKENVQLVLVWNYDDRPPYNEDDPTDHSAGVEWSWNERWEKGDAILKLVGEANKAVDEKHGGAAI